METVSSHATPCQQVRPQQLQPFRSSVVGKTLTLFERRRRSKESVKWGIINLTLFLLCYLKMVQVCIWYVLDFEHEYIILVEFFMGSLFGINSISNLYSYFAPTLIKDHVALSPKQRVLLGVDDEDKAFGTIDERREVTPVSSIGATTPILMPRRRRTSRPSPSSGFVGDTSKSSAVYTPSPIGSSPQTSRLSFGTQASPNTPTPKRTEVIFGRSPSKSPTGLEPSPVSGSSPSRITGSQRSPVSPKPGSPQGAITDVNSLDKYLKDQEDLDLKLKRAQLDTTPNSRQSFWTYGKPAYDFVPSPGTYQIASRSTQSTSSKDDDFSSGFIKYEETWKKIGVHPDDLDFWRENLRKWLAETVLERLIQEINVINNKLVQLGCSELQVGNISVSSLRSVSLSKSQHVPSLKSVIPYIDLTTNQEYLINRLQELSTGGCLRMFKWNSGGLYKGKPWDQDLPTDAQIILHLFCTYLDTHLPSNPRYRDGKSFTGLHYLKTPSKPSERKSDICIYQSRTYPPHFKVLQGDEVYDLPRGRNNLFHALLVFLHFVKIHNFGMLERVNLGLSGINILWVINKK